MTRDDNDHRDDENHDNVDHGYDEKPTTTGRQRRRRLRQITASDNGINYSDSDEHRDETENDDNVDNEERPRRRQRRQTVRNYNNDDNGRDGSGQTPFLQVADTGSRMSRSRSLIRRVSKPKQKRSNNDSLPRNDCVIS